MSIIETLVEKFPIRKTKDQKAAFREWVTGWAREQGYTANVESKKGLFTSNNVVIGDPETAEVTFTAHYDTPAVMPLPNFITPCNILVYLIYNVLVALLILLIPAAVAAILGFALPLLGVEKEAASGIAGLVGFISVYVALGVMMFGPANKHNVNDNTSGVAAVMELMTRLPEGERAKTAFILFDNEEKGMVGSSAYAGRHKTVKKEKLIINMDCVGDGEHIMFFANKRTRNLPCFGSLEAAMQAQQGRVYHMNKLENCIYPSDQASFKHGIAVCACNKMKVVGYYCDKIHTKKDTVCRQENLDFLAGGLTDFVHGL